MQLDFRIDLGYQMLYTRRQYHPEYCWDGSINCSEGRILSLGQLAYPYNWFGVCHSARETTLNGTSWKITTRRGMAGVHVVAEVESPEARFTVTTRSGTFCFSAGQVQSEGRIVFPVGPSYGQCTVIVTRSGYFWFRPKLESLDRSIEAAELIGAEKVSFARMPHAIVDSREEAEFDVTLPEFGEKGRRYWQVNLQAMTAQKRKETEFKDGGLGMVCHADVLNYRGMNLFQLERGYIPIEIRCDGKTVCEFEYFLRSHDMNCSIMHDIRLEIPFDKVSPGTHRFTLVNKHTELPLLVHRILFRPRVQRHLEMSLPRWARVGEDIVLGLRILEPDTPIRIEYGSFIARTEIPDILQAGYHEIRLVPTEPVCHARIVCRDLKTGATSQGEVEAIYDLPSENPEVKVGFDMTVVPHDGTGEMDRVLEYTYRTQMGNLVVFRPFTPPTSPENWRRWGEYCKSHHIYAMAVGGYEDGVLPNAAGEYYHASGGHEKSYPLYANEPDNESRTMKEAMERFIADISANVNTVKKSGGRISYGDASGGHRYSLLAGADFIRAETMVPHTMQHLSQCRAAAKALSSGEWGVHIAMQHCKQPNLESHLDWYRLSLLQSWMMGASFLYEEDSLFLMFKEEKQCWDDALTRGKRQITRQFYEFVKTHPRQGKCDVRIGHLLGRYAAPFNGFTAGMEQTPAYSVWGKFGRNERAWGHLQPEKGNQLMDVLMPGASSHPLRQRYDRRRFFFSGTPYGDFDQVPMEAGERNLSTYKLLMLLCWHTMIPQDYDKLKNYVQNGGTLLLSVPHLTTHADREFLATMDDPALYNRGDVRELCGVVIKGRGEKFSGSSWTLDPRFKDVPCPPLSRIPSDSPEEDGPCCLADVQLEGARPVIYDAQTRKPLLVEYQLGKGRVFLLTTWAYPGHEMLSESAGSLVSALADRYAGDYRIVDPERETFWTKWAWSETTGVLMALNTGWAQKDERKPITVKTPIGSFDACIDACRIYQFIYTSWGILSSQSESPYVEKIQMDESSMQRMTIRVHAAGRHVFQWYTMQESPQINVAGRQVPVEKIADRIYRFEICNEQKTCCDVIIQRN